MKKIILLFFCLSLMVGYAQKTKVEKPNYKKIEKKIAKEGSEFFYPTLMERFNAGDTTMTIEQKRCFYYGFIYQNQYSPYGGSDYSDSIRVILKKEELDISDYEQILVFSDSVLKVNPLDLTTLNYVLYCHDFLQDFSMVDLTMSKFKMIIDAILSSGTGESQKDPYYVIYVDHEYVLLNILGYKVKGQSLVGTCDYMEVAKNKDNIKGIYFDVSPSLNYLDNMFK
ncbi:MAG: hypothetical protein H6Q25_31 [Bacteroidetes bacterium]|nr:hypothetical protein [Bacteroidota bacterium]